MAAYTTRRRVEFRDTDAAGIVHFSAFFFWMESAEHEMLRTIDVAVFDPTGGSDRASWPRVSVACDYMVALRYGDEVDIDVSVDAIGRSSVTYGFLFRRDGVDIARGRVVAVHCLMHAGRKPEAVPMPADVAERLGRFAVES